MAQNFRLKEKSSLQRRSFSNLKLKLRMIDVFYSTPRRKLTNLRPGVVGQKSQCIFMFAHVSISLLIGEGRYYEDILKEMEANQPKREASRSHLSAEQDLPAEQPSFQGTSPPMDVGVNVEHLKTTCVTPELRDTNSLVTKIPLKIEFQLNRTFNWSPIWISTSSPTKENKLPME